jgi:hypothetical protein
MSLFILRHHNYYLISLIILSILIRWSVFSHQRILFWYDQARDATLSRQIIEKGDLKIQGPSASGTNDTLYHGVFYYYFLAPFYFLSGGDPLLPTLALVIWGSMAIIPIYLLAKEISNQASVGFIVSILYIFSWESVSMSVWLSNPSLALPLIPIFYYALYKLCFAKTTSPKWLLAVAICLGLTFQSALWLIYLWGSLILGLVYLYLQERRKLLPLLKFRYLGLAAFIFGLLVSSIILTELKLYQNHILSLSQLSSDLTRESANWFTSSFSVFNLLINKLGLSLIPTLPLVGFVVILVLAFIIYQKYPVAFWLIIIWFLSPLWLFILHPRTSIHTFVGLEIGVYLLLGLVLSQLRLNRLILSLFLVFYAAVNYLPVINYHQDQALMNYPQRGALLYQSLKLIDATYLQAKHQPFTISTYTNPLGYNTTWAYLYSWYGKARYGYLPAFVGPDQTGIFGADLIPQASTPSAIHFSIIEPSAGAPEKLKLDFLSHQTLISKQVAQELSFGSITLQVR